MGKAFIDRTGLQYGQLNVLRFLGKQGYSKPRWECVCSCGTLCQVTSSNLATGHTTSCGCLHADMMRARRIYPKEHSAEYRIWRGLKQRAGSKQGKNSAWYNHIDVSREWEESFDVFLRDMGKRPSPKHTVERLNNAIGYRRENCVWATAKTQANNRKTNHRIEFNGVTKTLAEWSEQTNIPAPTLLARLTRYGWSVEDALTTPVNRRDK